MTVPENRQSANASVTPTRKHGRLRQRRVIRSAAVFGALLLPALAAVAPLAAPTAQAVSCYGDYCSGQDPQSSGCANDARTITTGYVYGTGGASYVEVRWSDTCKTNWARVNSVTSNVKAVQQGGYTATYSSNNGSMSWSKMIYSPTLCVTGYYWGAWGTTTTGCV